MSAAAQDNPWQPLMESMKVWSVSLLLQFVIAYLIADHFNDEDVLFNAALIVLAIIAIRIALWANDYVIGLAMFYLYRNKWVTEIKQDLKRVRMPRYGSSVGDDPIEYLVAVADDANSDVEQIKMAASTLGAVVQASRFSFIRTKRYVWALQRAISEYRD